VTAKRFCLGRFRREIRAFWQYFALVFGFSLVRYGRSATVQQRTIALQGATDFLFGRETEETEVLQAKAFRFIWTYIKLTR
jgi:hypothetical protein